MSTLLPVGSVTFLASRVQICYYICEDPDPSFLEVVEHLFKMYVISSVADPDPNPDPHVFGPPGSGSTSQRYGSGSGSCSGSGSFYHNAKIVRKTLILTIL